VKRWKLLVALAGLAVVVAAGVVVLWPSRDRITQANFDRILEGMTRAEVEAILGPPGDYRTICTETTCALDQPVYLESDLNQYAAGEGRGGYWPLDDSPSDAPGQPAHTSFYGTWFGNDGYINVQFVSDAVDYKAFYHSVRKELTPLGNLLWRLKRQWRRWFP
jgi:hypothetical protein